MLTIVRVDNRVDVTRGILLVRGAWMSLTLEPPWKDNEPFESCIPTGIYPIEKYKSSLDWMGKYGSWTYRLLDVPQREAIEVHPGNIVDHTDGCILPGYNLGMYRGKPAVLGSGPAFRAFMRVMESMVGYRSTIHIMKLEV